MRFVPKTPIYKVGDERTKTGFLFFPCTLPVAGDINVETRWLEITAWTERLEHLTDPTCGASKDGWQRVRWAE